MYKCACWTASLRRSPVAPLLLDLRQRSARASAFDVLQYLLLYRSQGGTQGAAYRQVLLPGPQLQQLLPQVSQLGFGLRGWAGRRHSATRRCGRLGAILEGFGEVPSRRRSRILPGICRRGGWSLRGIARKCLILGRGCCGPLLRFAVSGTAGRARQLGSLRRRELCRTPAKRESQSSSVSRL